MAQVRYWPKADMS